MERIAVDYTIILPQDIFDEVHKGKKYTDDDVKTKISQIILNS